MWLVLLSVFVFTIFWYFYNVYSYWKKKGIPYITPIPLLGSIPKSMLQIGAPSIEMTKIYNKYPNEKVVGIYFLLNKSLMIKDLDLIKQIAVKHFDHFLDHTPLFIKEDTDPLFYRNLFSLSGKRWKDMRSTISPAFTSSKMKMMFQLVTQCGEQMVTELLRLSEANVSANGSATLDYEMKDLSTRFTNDVIATCAFGIKCDSLKDRDNEFYKMGKVVTNFTNLRMMMVSLLPMVMKILGEGTVPKKILNFFQKLILETVRYREKEGIIRPDLIYLLMEAKKGTLKHEEESKKAGEAGFAAIKETEVDFDKNTNIVLTDDDIVAQALIFFIAGFDTVSVLMSFAGHELAVNPDIQEKLQQEIDDVVSQSGEKVSYDVLFKMEYLDMVISETLRKWPPAINIDRVCTKQFDLVLNDKTLTIEPGISMVLPNYCIHNDPKYYKDPDKFDPERFSPENKHKIKPFTYFPFGLGPRACIGSRFALMETKVLLFYLLNKFSFVVTEKTDTKLELQHHMFRIAAKNGFWVGLKPRK